MKQSNFLTLAWRDYGRTLVMAVVTDALTPTYNTTVVGGAVRIPVFHDGISWKAH